MHPGATRLTTKCVQAPACRRSRRDPFVVGVRPLRAPKELGTEPQASSSSLQIVSTLILSASLYLMKCHLDPPGRTCLVHASLSRHGYLGQSALKRPGFLATYQVTHDTGSRPKPSTRDRKYTIRPSYLKPKISPPSAGRTRRRRHRQDRLRLHARNHPRLENPHRFTPRQARQAYTKFCGKEEENKFGGV